MLVLNSFTTELTPSFDELRENGRAHAEAGRLRAALDCFDGALAVAEERGSERLVDLAVCNRGAVLINMGRQNEVMAPLREILLRNSDTKNCLVAAYNLSRAHERNKQTKKGLFYARIACENARALDSSAWLIGSHNQIGNCLLGESYFEQAADEYRLALRLQVCEPSVARAGLLVNLGYSRMMVNRFEEGFAYAFAAVRWFRRFDAVVYLSLPHQDLCYAYLEIGRLERARKHGTRALELARKFEDPDRVKSSLYLLGETESCLGEDDRAATYFLELQQQFYPDAPDLVSILSRVDSRQLVNLRA